MKRREFIALLGGAATWPFAARAQQQAGKLPTIGFFSPNTRSASRPWIAAFVQRMSDLGWNEKQTVAIVYRYGEGETERIADSNAEPLMSASGQKQTLGSRLNKVRFTPETGHWLTGGDTSAKCQKRSFDHLVGTNAPCSFGEPRFPKTLDHQLRV